MPVRRSLSVTGGHEREGSPGRSRSERRVDLRLCKDVLASPRGKTTLRTGHDCVFTWPGTLRLSRPSSRRPVAYPATARRYAVRSGHAGTRPTAPVDGCGPKSPDSHRVVWGLISRLPVSRPGFPPVSRLPTRALPRRPPSSGFPSLGVLRFRPFGRRFPVRFPSDSLRVPFPLSNLHVSAAARRFCGRWSRAAGTKVTSSRRDPWLRSCRPARNADIPRERIGGTHRGSPTGQRTITCT